MTLNRTEAAEPITINFSFEIPASTAWWVCRCHALFGVTCGSLIEHVMKKHGITAVGGEAGEEER